MDARAILDNDESLEMARRTSKQSATASSDRVIALANALKAAGTDQADFRRAFAMIEGDRQLSGADLGEIASLYRGGGPKPSTRTAALKAIEKRQLELVRNKAQIEQAKKARPW